MFDIYCPSCREKISEEAETCPLCGAPTTAEARKAAEQAKKDAEEARRKERLAQEKETLKIKDKIEKEAIYNKKTGINVCPICKSGNVERYSFDGIITGGEALFCLGCFLTPLTWLFIPFAGSKSKGYECMACSHKWKP